MAGIWKTFFSERQAQCSCTLSRQQIVFLAALFSTPKMPFCTLTMHCSHHASRKLPLYVSCLHLRRLLQTKTSLNLPCISFFLLNNQRLFKNLCPQSVLSCSHDLVRIRVIASRSERPVLLQILNDQTKQAQHFYNTTPRTLQ